MCSGEHGQGLALVKTGLRLKAAFHGGYAQSSENWRFCLEGTRDLSQRDDRTQPGVLTPGNMSTQCPALQGPEDVCERRSIWSALHTRRIGSTAPSGRGVY
jgi:hypothetical protein